MEKESAGGLELGGTERTDKSGEEEGERMKQSGGEEWRLARSPLRLTYNELN